MSAISELKDQLATLTTTLAQDMVELRTSITSIGTGLAALIEKLAEAAKDQDPTQLTAILESLKTLKAQADEATTDADAIVSAQDATAK